MPHEATLLALARTKGILRSSDLAPLGIPRAYLTRLVENGHLLKTGRGLYVLSDAEWTEHHPLAEASRRAPGGIICLLSALTFHQMTSQLPHHVWMAIDRHAWRPKIDQPKLRVVIMSGERLTAGVDEHLIEGVSVRIYNPAKTVADCFRFRNKIGVDVAIEALRAYHRERRGTMDELMHYARIDRVAKVMLPYLESLS
ncbi:MAG: type IV toxin-antitoxin system AbiEi family antitoxin domain-containing protein [Candidatus Sericytochromatia bacterium]